MRNSRATFELGPSSPCGGGGVKTFEPNREAPFSAFVDVTTEFNHPKYDGNKYVTTSIRHLFELLNRTYTLVMKTASHCSLALLLSPTLFAQSRSDEVVERLTADLISLSSVRGMPEGSAVLNPLSLGRLDLARLKAMVKDQNPDLDSTMQRFAADAAERYDKYVIPWSVAYVVTSVLAGKDLPRNSVTWLVTSIVTALDSAFVCRRTSTPLRDSAEFGSALKRLRETLLSLGVAPSNVKIAVDNMIDAGRLVVDPVTLEPVAL